VSVDIDEASAWIDAYVRTDGPLELVHDEAWASVFRASAGDEPVWFKACAPTHAFEVPLTSGLALRSDVVTEVIAADADRRWLLMRDAGVRLADLGNPPERWLQVLPAYAELQIGERERVAEHLARGVPDLRLERLPSRYEDLLRAELPVDDEVRAALAAYRPRVVRSCGELADAGIGASVQHDDLHMNNVYVKDGRLRILDWGDASIAHPFFSLFETFRFLVEINGLAPDDPWFSRLRDAYLEPWGGVHRETFALALRIGGLARCIAWLDQREVLPNEERRTFDEGFRGLLELAIRDRAP
jgi:hypothetical protein